MEYIIILILLLASTLTYDGVYSQSFRKTKGAFGWYIIIFIIFVIFASLRDVSIGADTINYLTGYNDSSLFCYISTTDIENSRYQPFWTYLVAWVKEYLGYFNWLLALEAIFLNIVVFNFLWKYSKYPFLCLTLYFCTVYIGLNFETLREGISVALCLLAYEQLSKKKYIISFLFWICAFQIHVSALIALFYPITMLVKYTRSVNNLMFVIASVLLLVFPLLSSYINALELLFSIYSDNLADRFATYSNTEYDSQLSIFYYVSLVFRCIALPFITLYIMKEKTQYYGFIIIYIFLNILGAFSPGFERFSNYFVFFYIIYLADFCKYIIRNQKGYKPIFLITFVIILMYLNQSLILSRDSLLERYYPYKSIIN